jgi:hypothetical protein
MRRIGGVPPLAFLFFDPSWKIPQQTAPYQNYRMKVPHFLQRSYTNGRLRRRFEWIKHLDPHRAPLPEGVALTDS